MDIPLPTLARRHTSLDNREVRDFLLENFGVQYDDAPHWVKDCICGACGQVSGTQRLSPYKLYRLLTSLSEITTETVGTAINRFREAMDEELYSDRYTRMLCAALRCANQAIIYHRSYNPLPQRGGVERNVSRLPYSAEEMQQLKMISLKGSFEELKGFENYLKEKYKSVL